MMLGHLQVVGDQNDGVAFSAQLIEQIHHLGAAATVERARGFIRQDHLAAVHQRPGDADPLLLPAGELGGSVAHPVAQSEPREQRLGADTPRAAGHARIDSRNLDIIKGGQVRHQVIALEDEAEMFPPQSRQLVGVEGGHVPAGDAIGPPRRPIQAAQNIHQGRLA